MKNIDNKKLYRIINIVLIAVYCCIFAIAAAGGRFIASEGLSGEGVFNTSSFLIAIGMSLVIIAMMCVAVFIYRTLDLFRPYVVFAAINAAFIISMPFIGGMFTMNLFPWHFLMEIYIGCVCFLSLVFAIIISIVIRYVKNKKMARSNGR